MNFFRLRLLNTVLLFLVGIIFGFILKERFYPAPRASYTQNYQPSFPGDTEPRPQEAAKPEASAEAEETDDLGSAVEEPAHPRQPPAAEPEEDLRRPLVIETQETETVPDAKGNILRGSRDEFFRHPGDYAGRELEMALQMITVKKAPGGWRLNFVYAGADKRVDYLYVDDPGLLGEKPDLRIGYVYLVRFLCEKGETADGNVLSGIKPTGNKAAWATGLSAVE